MGTTYYFLPTRNLFGEGAVKEVGSLMESLGGKKVMIVTDAFLAKSGMAANIQSILTEAGVNSVVFDGAEPNPTDLNVEKRGWLYLKKMNVIQLFLWAAVLLMTVPKGLAL